MSWPDSVPGFDTNGAPVDERYPSEDGHWDIEHIRRLLTERDAYKAALRYCEFHMTETHWPKDHPMLLAVQKALGSTPSGETK